MAGLRDRLQGEVTNQKATSETVLKIADPGESCCVKIRSSSEIEIVPDTGASVLAHPIRKETRTKRLYLLAKPSVHQKLDAYAKANGDTFNNLVHRLMEDFIKEHDL